MLFFFKNRIEVQAFADQWHHQGCIIIPDDAVDQCKLGFQFCLLKTAV